ncbi:MAG: hypothetical protein ABI589_02730 [Burkholderiales bacterium]
MNATANPELARFRAAGVRHAVLLRVLPGLRHELANPVSILRMTSRVLQRRLEATPIDVGYVAERVAALDAQTDALTDTLDLLQNLIVGPEVGSVTRPLLVVGCVGLLAPALRMQGITLEVEAGLGFAAASSASDSEPLWPRASALRYLLLAAICHLEDSAPALERVRIEPEGSDALRLRWFTRAGGSRSPELMPGFASANRNGDELHLDAASIDFLSHDLGHRVGFDDAGIVLHLAAA